MRSLLLLCLAFGLSFSAVAQSDSVAAEPANNILTTKVYRKGLYRSLEEFKTNSPSVTDIPIVIDTRSGADRFVAGGTGYKLYIDMPEGQKDVILKGSYWGYCDGQDVYLRLAGTHVNVEKFETIGLYCYYLDHSIDASGATAGMGLMFGVAGALAAGVVAASGSEEGIPSVMNFNTGNFAQLTTGMVEKMLERDPELKASIGPVKKFKGDRLAFIQTYNDRHNAMLIRPF